MERQYVLAIVLKPIQLLRYCRFGNSKPVTLLHLRRSGGALLGCSLLSAALATLVRLSRGAIQAPAVQPFPDGEDSILDFPNANNIAGRSLLTDILDRYRKGVTAGLPGVGPELDDDGARSLECHLFGEQLRTTIAAIYALRTMKVPLAAMVLNEPDIPPRLAAIISDFFGVPVHWTVRWPRIPAMARIVWRSRLSIVFKRPLPHLANRWPGLAGKIDFVHELLDPEVWQGTPSSVAFLEKGADSRTFAYYVTERQEKRLRLPRERWAAAADHVFFLEDMLAMAHRFRLRYSVGVARLAWGCLRGRISVGRANEEAMALRNFLALEAFFGALKPRVSLHTPFGNGRCEWAKDSGVVTAAARAQGVLSLGYQTRCVSLKSHEELFESYDIWCAWGEIWAEIARKYGFLANTCIIGDVNLAEYDNINETKYHDVTVDAINIVVFPFVVWVPVEYYICEYCLSMMDAVLTAAGRLHRETGKRYRVSIKAKDREDIAVFTSHQALNAAALREGVPMACLSAERHEVADAVATAHIVVAIGFTTPGMDAILFGKPAYYFTAIEQLHPAFEPLPSFVVHDAEELYQAMRDRTAAPAQTLNRFDPFRDGKAMIRLRRAALEGCVPRQAVSGL
ncbi:MAG: hypothetical protein HYS06_07095 [Methylocystis sp.]|nr:hypothetical protein [Methylocystis sp.]